MEEVSLVIENQIFNVKKDVLCEHSDYFRAMFSGNYVENEQKQITIDVVDANSMQIILQYMEMGLIDLSEISLSMIGDLAIAANFLQITELIKQIEYTLEIQLSISNWIETMTIAENASYIKLEQLAAAYGLYSFKDMKPKYVPSIYKLFWYLSHPYLDTKCELEVFKFGYKWVMNTELGADALLIILACLDVKKITTAELNEIKNLMREFINSLAYKVVECYQDLVQNDELSTSVILAKKVSLSEKFTQRVYSEVLSLVNESKGRMLKYIPAVPLWTLKDDKPEQIPHFMYTFSVQDGFVKWLEVAQKNLWGWSVVSWGPMRLVVVGGEHGRGTGMFMRDVKVYDTLKQEWTQHGVELPPRRHGGVAVVGDSLYIMGGVGGFRVVLDSAIVYDLRERTFRKIAKLPDAIQNPAVCSHENVVYAAGHNSIYRYEDLGESDRWVRVVATDIRMSCMMSFKGAIYCTQNYFSYLYMFRPDVDKKLEMMSNFSNPPAAICNLGNRLIFFTRTMCGQSDILAVEEYFSNSVEEKPKVIWSQANTDIKVNDVAGSCSLVMVMPPLCREISQYHQKHLMRYDE